MNSLIEKSEAMQKKAYSIIKETRLMEAWTSIGAKINPVGSFEMELMLNHKDIDFHIYTDPFSVFESFRAVSKLAENKNIKAINYSNLIDAEDRCLEWHAFYEDDNGESWQIDMIHILKDSPYAGYFEKVARRIKNILTPEIRTNILNIKNSVPENKKVMGIKIYQAVIEGKACDFKSFEKWESKNPDNGIITWMP